MTVDAICEFAAFAFRTLNALEEIGSCEDHVGNSSGSVAPGVVVWSVQTVLPIALQM